MMKAQILTWHILLLCLSFSSPFIGQGQSIVVDAENPYIETFNNKNALSNFTIIDYNKDGITWDYDAGGAIYTWEETGLDANDWLISPGLMLRKDHVYLLSIEIATYASFLEQLAISLGSSPSIEAMTQEILPKTTFGWGHSSPTDFHFTVENDGDVYIGFNALSSAENGYLLFLDKISLYELAHVEAPEAPTLTIIAGRKGSLEATISYHTPEKSVSGKPLETINKIEIYRDGTLIHTETTPRIGYDYTYTDTPISRGLHTYRIIAYNKYGSGLSMEKQTYIGEDVPGPVSNIRLVERPNNQIELTWDAPTKGLNEGYVNPNNLSYRVYNVGGVHEKTVVVTERYFSESYLLDSHEQKLVWYTIEAGNGIGTGSKATSDTICIGKPYVLPYFDSFASLGRNSGPWTLGDDTLSAWELMMSGTYASPQDNDAGFAAFITKLAPQGRATLRSPKIDLSKNINPKLSFWVWHHDKADNRLRVSVETGSRRTHELGIIDQSYTGSNQELSGWVQHTYMLSDIKDETSIQIAFEGINVSVSEDQIPVLYLDHIEVVDVLPYDIRADQLLTNKEEASVGEVIEFTCNYTNIGSRTIDDYELQLYRNDLLVDSIEGENIQPDSSSTVVLRDIPNGDAPISARYHVAIICSTDQEPENNITESLILSITPGLPYITDLAARRESERTHLTWNQPPGIEESDSKIMVESWEEYQPFIINHIGPWKLIDGDGHATAGIQDGSGNFIDYPNVESKMAFQIFNSSKAGLSDEGWAAHSGHQVIAAFTSGNTQNDDWLISPEIIGGQTISFWACSPMNSWYNTLEQIEILYSEKTSERKDFIKVGKTITVSGTWTQYSHTLPEKARYFAIRCISNNQFILFLDDITYQPKRPEFYLIGYNIYRNEVKITETPMQETHYTDDVKGANRYYVTAVYNTGESRPSNVVDSSQGTEIRDLEKSSFLAIGLSGGIHLQNPEDFPIRIYTVKGQMVLSGHYNGFVSVPADAYIVIYENEVYKVQVSP